MPLRFRSVVPYTLPGVLALIGWWWYISRKKERLVGGDGGGEADATDTGLRATPTEGSNGLVVERGSVSPASDTERPTHRPPKKVAIQRTDQENISHIPVRDSDASPSLGQSTEAEEIHKPSAQTPPLFGKEDIERKASTIESQERASLGLGAGPEKRQLKDPEASVEEVVLHCRSNEVSSSAPSSSAGRLSDAERPEPEGEVAKHHSATHAQDEMMISCAVTPAKLQRGVPSEADSQGSTPSSQDFHQHIRTSTPASAADPASITQDSIASPVTAEEAQTHVGEEQEEDLERLAAGLICGVISAATQEVLGVTRCPVSDNGGDSPTGSRRRSQQEPITQQQLHHHHLMTNREEKKEQQAMTNGGSLAPAWEPRVHQTDAAPRGHWRKSQDATLHTKLKGDDLAARAEDSACSTCHSEDGVSSEDLQLGAFDGQTDAIQITDLSAAQPLGEASAEAATVLGAAEENSVDAVCEIKRLNGMGPRNGGAHGACELETDQSGGSDVNSMDSVDSGCTMGTGESQSNHASLSSELVIWEIEVPKQLVGRLIGKQGRFVSFVKQNSGAKIYISTLPYTQDFQICHIEGTQQHVDKALALIGKKFKDLDLTNLYAPPQLPLPSLPMTSWLLLPSGVTVEVIVVNIVSAGHVFVQQHTHPTYHALRSLDQQMFLCYSQPGTPALPSPAEVGVICAAPAVEGAWWRAQVITFYKETSEVEIRYVDYGGYDRVKIDSLRQIRSDFVTLPFQGAEVLLDNVTPLPGEDRFSAEATSALEEMTRGVALLAQVSNYDNNTGLPLVHLWNMVGEEVVSLNRTLAERGLGAWVDGF